jgi:integrase
MAKKKRARYGDYSAIIEGKLYGVVNIPNGDGTYHKKRKIVENKTEARQWALEQLAKNSSGEILIEKKKLTFREYAEWYKEQFLVSPIYQDGKKVAGLRTWQKERLKVDRLVRWFGSYDLKKISVDVILRYKNERLRPPDAVSITAVNRDLQLLRSMLKRAKTRKKIAENPFDIADDENLIDPSLESGRKSKLNGRIAARLLARSRKSEQPLLHYLVWFLYSTGARPSEVYPYQASIDDDTPREPICWANVIQFNFKAVLLVSYKGKKRKERLVPTSLKFERILKKFFEEKAPRPDDLLFPVTDFKRSWATLCRRAHVADIRQRDFRHYFNNKIRQNPNLNDMDRMLLMGHESLTTNLRYSSVDETFIDKYRQATEPTLISKAVN